MLEDLLFELNDKARDFSLMQMAWHTVSPTETPTAEVIGEVDGFLSKACTTLDEVLKILAVVDSPLYKLKSRVDGVKLAAEQNELKRFLKSH